MFLYRKYLFRAGKTMFLYRKYIFDGISTKITILNYQNIIYKK